jgi:hypothetical protein
VWYWLALPRYPYAGLALAYLPLVMAWRSSDRYFVLLPLAAITILALTLRQRTTAEAVNSDRSTAGIGAVAAAASVTT